MRRKIFVFGAFMTALFTLNNADAQDFVRDKLHLFAEDNPVGDRMVIRQGETKRLVGYITVIGEKDAKNYKKVRNIDDDGEYLLEKLTSDVDKQHEAEKKKAFKGRTDTLCIIADSVVVEKIQVANDDGDYKYTRGVFLYQNGLSTHQIISGDENYWDEALNSLAFAWDELKSQKEILADNGYARKKRYRQVLDWSLGIGYGYLNYSDDGFFSTPSGNDPYALKWSDKWDFMFKLNFFPQNSVSFTTGLGLQSNVFRFDDGFAINAFNINPPATNLSKEKCKLVARYITVPLILNVRATEHVAFHAGVIGGLNYRNSHTGFKRQFKADGQRTEQSTGRSFKDFNTFKADVMLGVQFYGVTFYVSHALTNMFKDSYIKEARPFSIGIML